MGLYLSGSGSPFSHRKDDQSRFVEARLSADGDLVSSARAGGHCAGNSEATSQDERHLGWILRLSPEANHDICANLLREFGSLGGVLAGSPSQQFKASGFDQQAVVELTHFSDAMAAVLMSRLTDRPVISSSKALNEYLRYSLAFKGTECVRVLYLNSRKLLIKDELIAQGTVNQAKYNSREIIKRAFELCSSSIILVHNHPSGSSLPSSSDRIATQRLSEIAQAVDVELIDHLIVSSSGIYSFRQDKTL